MKKGFTLLELLIVIGIMAVLAPAATIVLNPAQLLAQARDSQRISDMDALKAAISLYLTDVTTPSLGACSTAAGTKGRTFTADPTDGSFAGPVGADITGTRVTTGAGWVDVNFSGISGGSPLAVLPIDPKNTGNTVYRYACNQTNRTFELNACLESSKYISKMGEDGGDKPASGASTACEIIGATSFYEVGTVLTL